MKARVRGDAVLGMRFGPVGALAIVFALLVGGCALDRYDVERFGGFNQKLRRDRLPLTPEQLAFDASGDALRFGPYRFAADDLVSPLVPAEEPSTRLPQSDCWWMAQSAHGGGDAMLASWEALGEIQAGEASEQFHDPDDGKLDIGFCRLNDPESRAPLYSTSVDDEHRDYFEHRDCSGVANGASWFELDYDPDDNFFQCTSDAAFAIVTLSAWTTAAPDPLNRCDVLQASFTRRDRVINGSMDFYDNVSAGEGDAAVVAACTHPQGDRLIPPIATQYELFNSDDVPPTRLKPVLLPATAHTLLARKLSRAGPVSRWSTPVTTGVLGARWEENFSRRLAVQRVRLFQLAADGGKRYQRHASDSAPLCIEDPDVDAQACRWVCAASADAAGELQYALLDERSCSRGQSAPESLRATPTFTHERERAVASTPGATFTMPLVWSLASASEDLWIEFDLLPLMEPAALRAEPALDTGIARVGQFTRRTFRVNNDGAHPLRITHVAVDAAHGGHPGDFTTQLPYAPEPLPLPIEVWREAGKMTVKLTPDAEERTLFTLYEDDFHVRFEPRAQGFTARVDGIRISDDRGLLLRDTAASSFRFDPAAQPAVRTSYALRLLPFTLMPGESFDVSVRARPSAPDARHAFVRVRAVSTVDASQRRDVLTRVSAFGLLGPALSTAPTQLNIGAEGSGVARRRAVMIQNAGDTAGTIGAPELTQVGGAQLPAGSQFTLDDPYRGGGTLAVGESRVVGVNFLSDCSRGVVGGIRDEQAELAWQTVDGRLVVPVVASTYCSS